MPSTVPEHQHRRCPGRHASTRRHRGRLVVLAVTAAAGAGIAIGPVSAHASTGRPATPTITTDAAATGLPGGPAAEATDAFGQLLADAHARTAALARAERARVVAELRERRERLAKKHARLLAAKVRASRAALRSTVVRPVVGGYHLTARFDDGGSLWGSGQHTGLDFACSTGTPVHVVADGVVTSAGYDGAYGNRIEVRHADGTITTYNHLSAIVVHAGSVHAGEAIGRVGSTGNTTGAHLHFEVQRGGEYVDPEDWLRAHYVTY